MDLGGYFFSWAAKKNPILSRFFSFLEFTVIYWIRNNFPILCYLLLLRIAKVGKFLIHKEDDSNFLGNEVP